MKVWRIRWPQCRRYEVGHLSLHESDGVTCSMCRDAVLLKHKENRPGISGVCLAVTCSVQVGCCDSIFHSLWLPPRQNGQLQPNFETDADLHHDWLHKGQVSFEAVGFRRRPYSLLHPNGCKEYLSNTYELPKIDRITWRLLSNWWCKYEQFNTNNFTVV